MTSHVIPFEDDDDDELGLAAIRTRKKIRFLYPWYEKVMPKTARDASIPGAELAKKAATQAYDQGPVLARKLFDIRTSKADSPAMIRQYAIRVMAEFIVRRKGEFEGRFFRTKQKSVGYDHDGKRALNTAKEMLGCHTHGVAVLKGIAKSHQVKAIERQKQFPKIEVQSYGLKKLTLPGPTRTIK